MGFDFLWINEINSISKMVIAINLYGVNTKDKAGFYLLHRINRMTEEQIDVLLSFKPSLTGSEGLPIWTTYFLLDIGYGYVKKLIDYDKNGVYVKKQHDGVPTILERTIRDYKTYMESQHVKHSRDIIFFENKIKWLQDHKSKFDDQIHETTKLLDDMQIG